MAAAVLIPKLGMTMTEGTVAEWLVPDGASVQPGAPVYRLETEKIQMDVEAEAAGVVRQIVAPGTVVACGAAVAYILAPGEALPDGVAPAAAVQSGNGASAATPAGVPAAATPGGRVLSSPVARRLAKERGVELARVHGTGPGGRVTEADVLAYQPPAVPPSSPAARRLAKERGVDLARVRGTGPDGRITEADVLAYQPAAGAQPAPAPAPPAQPAGPVSPLVRAFAGQLGVDLATVPGTGPGGRITREDVEAAAAAVRAAPRPAATAPSPVAGPAAGSSVPVRGMRKVIAERMHASLQSMAQLTLSMDAWMDEAVKLRTQLIEEWAPEGVRPSYTDLVIRAVAKALERHPRVNAELRETEIALLEAIHVGMAVALDEGLVVPVIRDANRRSLKEIAAESTRLAEAARAGRLGPDDYAGGTFSVTALGMYGVDLFTPIVNPPNVAILGVGRIRDAVDWEGDRPVRRSAMTLSLTWDHRVLDGAPAAAFVQTIKGLLEAPYRLLV